MLALNEFITSPDTPPELGWLHHNHFKMSDIRSSVDLSWVCEYQHTRHSYLKQCLQSLRIPNKSFKVGSGEKCFELVDLILYNDYDRIFSLKPKDGADESNTKPSLDVGRMLLHFMPQDLQDEYKEIFNEHTKQKGVDPITHSYHQASSGQPFKQALKAFAKMHIIAHPEDASSDVQLRDVDKGVCMVIDDIILDIKENKNKFLKAKREGDTDEDWMYSMNRVFRPLEHFFQGLIYRYRIFHTPEEARLPEIAGAKRRRDDADRELDLFTANQGLPRMLDIMERSDENGKSIVGTYKYAIEMCADALRLQSLSSMGARPIGNDPKKPKPKPKKTTAAKGGPTTRSAGIQPKPDDTDDETVGKEKKSKRAKQKERKAAARAKKEKENEPRPESPKGILKLGDNKKTAADKAAAKAAEKKNPKVGFAKSDKFKHPVLSGMGSEAGNYKEVMTDYVKEVVKMVKEDHPGAAEDLDRLCFSEVCREEGCRFNKERFPDHPPMMKRDKKSLMGGTGECGFCHIDDNQLREEILQKAHTIRVDIWDNLSEAIKKDPKCRYDAKAEAYAASTNGA